MSKMDFVFSAFAAGLMHEGHRYVRMDHLNDGSIFWYRVEQTVLVGINDIVEAHALEDAFMASIEALTASVEQQSKQVLQ